MELLVNIRYNTTDFGEKQDSRHYLKNKQIWDEMWNILYF